MELDIGCGSRLRPGFTGVDRKLGQEAYPLAYANESCEEVVASHVLEHFSHRETALVLADWVRVLKPGGWLKLAVPDFDYASTHRDHPHWKMWIMGGHIDGDDCHGAIFIQSELAALMRDAGLVNLQAWESEIEDCARLPVSLNLMGQKVPV